MSDQSIVEFAKYLFYRFADVRLLATEKFVRENVLQELIHEEVVDQLSSRGFDALAVTASYVPTIFNELLDDGIIVHRPSEITGDYYKFKEAAYPTWRNVFLNENEIHAFVNDIGDEYLEDMSSVLIAGMNDVEDRAVVGEEQEGEIDSIGFTANLPAEWSELSSRVTIESTNEAFFASLNAAITKLDEMELDQATKSQARTFLIAARDLSESPDPPSDIVWELIHRAGSICGILGLFLTIFTAGLT